MGNRSNKLSLRHGTRQDVFHLEPDPLEVQHRFASVMGFVFAIAVVHPFDNDEYDNGLIESDD